MLLGARRVDAEPDREDADGHVDGGAAPEALGGRSSFAAGEERQVGVRDGPGGPGAEDPTQRSCYPPPRESNDASALVMLMVGPPLGIALLENVLEVSPRLTLVVLRYGLGHPTMVARSRCQHNGRR